MPENDPSILDTFTAEYGDDAELIITTIGHPDATPNDDPELIRHTNILSNGRERVLMLGFDTPDHIGIPDDDTAEAHHGVAADGQINVYKTVRPEIGIGIFLQFCEVTGIDSNDVYDSLRNGRLAEDSLNTHQEWRDTFTNRDRRLRLLDLAEERRGNPLFDHHLETGEFRPMGHPPADVEEQFMDTFQSVDEGALHPQKCYQNCLNFMLLADDRPESLRYCEGIALPPHAARPITHAWLELDGHPFEITYPWNRPHATDFTYFGTAIPMDEFDRAVGTALETEDRSFPTPLSIDAETAEELQNRPNYPVV